MQTPSASRSGHDYLVETTFAPFSSLLSPPEALHFIERFALPTLETCQRLQEEGRILAGGTALAAGGLSFIIRTETPEQLEEIVGRLPLSTRAQTRVLPLGTFAARAATVRARREQIRASLPEVSSPVSR